MQVKKFEARTMKEALEMVKTQLGPDAIILSAKDNKKSFGLVGEGSVEITAAVSENVLHKKKFVESRLRDEDREKLTRSPARIQKQVMEKMVSRYLQEKEMAERQAAAALAPKPQRQVTSRRYIDIDNEQHQQAEAAFEAGMESSEERIRLAAKRAWAAFEENDRKPAAAPAAVAPAPSAQSIKEAAEIQALRNEIRGLKDAISQFQKVPQTVVSHHPGAEHGLGFELSAVYEKLIHAGVAVEVTVELLQQAQQEMPPFKLKNKALVDGWVAKKILDSTRIAPHRAPAQVQVLVGPSGSGKTTTLVKMASHYAIIEKKKVALVTFDTQKVGAAEQLRIYSQILNMPFAVVRKSEDWSRLMAQMSSYDVILVDSPAASLKSMEEMSRFSQMLPPANMKPSLHLVLSVLSKDSDLHEIGKRFQSLNYQDVIFTGLDETSQHGVIYNFQRRFETALYAFSTGQRVPEDFEMATRERMLDLLFKLTQSPRREQEAT